ncbi:hypothetical protein OB955_06625 [Halobacteria archaeon AArc-m2/3/4]|uniref:Uncharacterized protein n=1 Tax=Natronoglomus mannanivorans TaxID=2979990 RepID=A0AAP2YX77_9EURY|nr:hypothetical protein [Halobacteria archaeon AArc-xg1-1]MCU4972411.1 hypothetical protein [Halobacteria archaeon AArc-m2/3/4]
MSEPAQHRVSGENGTDSETVDHVDRLERARDRLATVDARIDDHGEETVEDAADAYQRARKLLEDYVDRATGTGRENFKAYIELEGQFSSLVEGLPADIARREAFESALEAIDKRRLKEADFERAEEALEPGKAFSELLEERTEAREALAETRKEANKRLRTIDDEIDHRNRLLELSSADLEAPVDRLREPIAAYNEAVYESFVAYRQSESAREVFDVLERSRWYPLVPFEQPPEELREYVSENGAGTETIPKLLEYANYSRSKLDHYVDDADELKRRVATQQTYLEGIDAEPLSVAWPPAPAAELRYRLRELRPFVERIGGEELVVRLRELRQLALGSHSDSEFEYDRLQTAAVAVEQLTEDQRRRLADGRIEEELEALREEHDRIQSVLATEN